MRPLRINPNWADAGDTMVRWMATRVASLDANEFLDRREISHPLPDQVIEKSLDPSRSAIGVTLVHVKALSANHVEWLSVAATCVRRR